MNINIYGASHSRFIGATVEGIEPGVKINLDLIKENLQSRQGIPEVNTSRKELDKPIFIQGVKDNIIVAKKISFVIENKNFRSKDYEFGIVRPSHADIVGYQIEGSNYDFAGGGKFSGRMTSLYVVIGSICEQVIEDKTGMKVYGHIRQVGNIIDKDIRDASLEQLAKLDPTFSVIDDKVKAEMIDYLTRIKKQGDSHGAGLEFVIKNPALGLGGMYFDSFESRLSSRMFGIGGVKGISFGEGFGYQNSLGSDSNDELYVQKNKIFARTNKQGGINGGFSNGVQDIVFSLAVRPTPTIFKEQNTVRFTGAGFENYIYKIKGRHDSFIANRVLNVARSMTYICLYEMHNEME